MQVGIEGAREHGVELQEQVVHCNVQVERQLLGSATCVISYLGDECTE